MDLKGKKVLVIGTGVSGIGSSHLLAQNDIDVILFDQNKDNSIDKINEKIDDADKNRITIVIGDLEDDIKREISLVVPSPAVPLDTEFIEDFRKRNIPIWSEIELAYNFAKGKLIAITGTNGKTTTTTLVGEIMKAYEKEVYVVGNIGHSYALEAPNMTDSAVSVAELSSFQLEAVENFHAQVSAILNVTPDHLNRHHTMENYAACKENVTHNQTKDDVCVLNFDNEYTRDFARRCPARVIFFSSTQKIENGFYLDGEEIMFADKENVIKIMNIHDMNLVGTCNIENVMAAIAMTMSMGVPMSTILRVIRDFKAVEHRIEYCGTKGGVDYYNDSKGTNPDAAIQGIKAMSKPTYLIGGGYDKGSEFDEWINAFDGKVKELVLIGATADKIDACARKNGFNNIHHEKTFEDAMKYCSDNANEGEAVLLSPACASWDMFKSYEERGKIFKDYVASLK